MTEAQIKSVALFFYFTLADKTVAFAASTETAHIIRKKNNNSSEFKDSVLVYACYKVWKKYLKKSPKNFVHNPISEQGWLVPAHLKLELWWQFSKETEPITLLTLVWAILLDISDKDIAEGMGATEGTVRYRIGKGLKSLGMLQPSSGGLL